MVTAILSALPQEQAGLHHSLEQPVCTRHAGRSCWQGYLHGQQPVVLALSGIGKVAAATTASALIERFAATRIVFTGVAGGIGQGVQVGDAVVAQDYVQHEKNRGQIPIKFWAAHKRNVALMAGRLLSLGCAQPNIT